MGKTVYLGGLLSWHVLKTHVIPEANHPIAHIRQRHMMRLPIYVNAGDHSCH